MNKEKTDCKKYIFFNGTSNLVWYNCYQQYGEVSIRATSDISGGENSTRIQDVQGGDKVCKNCTSRGHVTHE
jgi:hypothetical protein